MCVLCVLVDNEDVQTRCWRCQEAFELHDADRSMSTVAACRPMLLDALMTG
jgi:hypothetical protein